MPRPRKRGRVNEFEMRRLQHLTRVADFGRQLPADAYISHESAAVVHGFATYDVPEAVRVTRTHGRGVRTSDLHVNRASLRPLDCCVVDGIPVTSPARTVVDLGRWLPFGPALVTADSALRAGVPRRYLQDVLRHQWTWPRVRHAMPVVRDADARSESALESFTRSRFITLRLPMPDLQQNIFGEHGWVARSDFLWKKYGVAGEADGKVKYLNEELWAEKQRQDDIEEVHLVIRWIWRTAHAPDGDFSRRLLNKLDLGLDLKRLREAS
jgi:hypothetical protein